MADGEAPDDGELHVTLATHTTRTEAEIKAAHAVHLERVADGDLDAVFDFFLVRGIDLRSGQWSVTGG